MEIYIKMRKFTCVLHNLAGEFLYQDLWPSIDSNYCKQLFRPVFIFVLPYLQIVSLQIDFVRRNWCFFFQLALQFGVCFEFAQSSICPEIEGRKGRKWSGANIFLYTVTWLKLNSSQRNMYWINYICCLQYTT